MGNYTLSYDGSCFTLGARTWRIPDGTYSAIQFQDGCIVGVGQMPEPSYTPAPCCSDTSSNGGSTTTDITVSPDACNLTSLGAAGLATFLYVSPGNGVSVSGCGTHADPLRISVSATGDSTIVATSGAQPITVSGDGSSTAALVIGMATQITAGDYAGFSVNQYGLVTGYSAPSNGASVTAMVGFSGVSAQEQPIGSGVYSVGLASTGVTAGMYRVGRYELTVNAQGQITGISEAIAPVTAGSFYSPPNPNVPGDTGKTVSYNADGLITGIA
ncbi:hypothetical protein [Paraburkholderia dinghuensis]|uniref:Uncharacterized protein n=1 Tax=Paraburkholderia dinghuensis TaxID=2305225 RepID=A0A3N6MRN2_9BURK|nr:hypothetical protein [Paraburkholderia dinghuensis]RQH06624.1 hypothetical protein D1Y85_12185 [Paraburkholderia dinghuensis]